MSNWFKFKRWTKLKTPGIKVFEIQNCNGTTMGHIQWSVENKEYLFFPGQSRCFNADSLDEVSNFLKKLESEDQNESSAG